MHEGHKTGIVYTPLLDMVPAEPELTKTAMVDGGTALTLLAGQRLDNFSIIMISILMHLFCPCRHGESYTSVQPGLSHGCL